MRCNSIISVQDFCFCGAIEVGNFLREYQDMSVYCGVDQFVTNVSGSVSDIHNLPITFFYSLDFVGLAFAIASNNKSDINYHIKKMIYVADKLINTQTDKFSYSDFYSNFYHNKNFIIAINDFLLSILELPIKMCKIIKKFKESFIFPLCVHDFDNKKIEIIIKKNTHRLIMRIY